VTPKIQIASMVMAQIVRLEEDIFVAHQLVEADFAELAARGFRSVVNNRPDGEAPGQLPNRQAEALARRHGLEFHHLPVTGANITDEDVVDAFAQLLDGLPGPILCYCRTGRRCATLWTQVAAARLGVAAALETASTAGYDMEILREDLVEQASVRAERSGGPVVAPPSL
jgi:uncharacterized protein (TIGR01244 family)